MTPQEALKLLDSACSQLNISREAHVKMQQATTTLEQFIKEHTKPETDGDVPAD